MDIEIEITSITKAIKPSSAIKNPLSPSSYLRLSRWKPTQPRKLDKELGRCVVEVDENLDNGNIKIAERKAEKRLLSHSDARAKKSFSDHEQVAEKRVRCLRTI